MRYQKGTFVTVPNIQTLEKLPPSAQALFMWLCSYADEQGQCFPSRSVLANNLHCSIRSVDTHLNTLIKQGYIKKENRFRDNEQTSNLYQIMLIDGEQKLHGGGCKICTGGVQNLRTELNPLNQNQMN